MARFDPKLEPPPPAGPPPSPTFFVPCVNVGPSTSQPRCAGARPDAAQPRLRRAPYNAVMTFPPTLDPWGWMSAAMPRLTLLLNHVLASEAAATQRLQPHAGSVLVLRCLPAPGFLPPPPDLAFEVTPAGLLEWKDSAQATTPDLEITVDGSAPGALAWSVLSGQTPAVQVQGDARLAADVQWLMTHLRWDIAADLERVLGPGPAHALQSWLTAVRDSVLRFRPGGGSS